MVSSKAFECFIGAWGFLNATLVNTTTSALIPEWHSVYPSGISVYTPAGYNAFIITANDTTEPEKRPKELHLPASPSDPDSRWALVGKYSLAAGGPVHLSNVIEGDREHETGPSGLLISSFQTATLPSWVGTELTNTFQFYDDCRIHVLKATFGDVVQTVWFYRLPEIDLI